MPFQRVCDRLECGKTYAAEMKYLNRGQGRFCSNLCSGIALNPRTTCTPKGLRITARKIWIERHNGAEPICVKCARKADVHHKDGDPSNNAPDNHDGLCRSHHTSYENRLHPKRKRS